MNLNLLRAFVTVIDSGSFSKAAANLYISQPALSQNIKQLENHFAVSLIKRTTHGLSLTEAGKILYEHAKRMMTMAVLMEEDMSAFRASLNDTLLLGATSVIGGFAVPCSIFIFKRNFPEAKIKLKLGNRRQILDQLREETIEIAIVEGERPDNFVTSEIHCEEMVVVVPATAEWPRDQALPWKELCRRPLILREEGSATRATVEQGLREAGLDPENLNVVMELTSIDSIKAAVEAGHGFSILPRMAVKKELFNRTLSSLTVTDLSIVQPIHIAYKKKPHSTIAREFLKLMKSSAKEFC
ncbi:MAG TPA: LysR family transcriptional regulator [Selenomonadales bacterium]|nr:LysR family transcriptional regulator [Selenomonadales bacterium]